jgi:hypothetical protein
MFFIQLPRSFPALPVDFSVTPSERPFYNNITQMSTTGSRFHVDPLPVPATSAAAVKINIVNKSREELVDRKINNGTASQCTADHNGKTPTPRG